MYKVLSIGGRDYKLEYNVEAALYKDGVDRLIDFLSGTFGIQGEDEITKGLTEEEKGQVRTQLLGNLKYEVTNLPNTALTLFYAGLLEYHGEDGDKTVLSKKDAKALVTKLFEEQPEGGVTDFAELLAMCIEQMGEDGFFKKTGLEKLIAQSEDAKPNRAARRAATKPSKNK